ncbi:protein phosphatase 2C domain-containing protein [Exiguobacterium sp. TBG-PICH-001]|uniref:protein phosphatase 2C domain-containing protein n=1 Tax=Exiguobacterium abrahamii TaxID=2785532 RepID=UPI0018A7ACC4|nr:protein phosphatase 2C domain-containing protein [Exiguobacterium sp. TBG-PICH-001]MBF8152977.1 protein phosphatase 2C domain-containing protein [Exiguobacterium sp. TBG-PICH-001]
MQTTHPSYFWVGYDEPFVDTKQIDQIGRITLGRFGGCSRSGQYKNEDGAAILIGDDWEMTVVLDAHKTADSAALVLQQLARHESHIRTDLDAPLTDAFRRIETTVLDFFQDPDFLAACATLQGETACLITVRKGRFIWWFSVGDVVLYLFHPDLMKMGQAALNQRQFYEWIGRANTFALPVPSYTRGVRELRQGENQLFMTTDGLLECPGTPYADARQLEESLRSGGVKELLSTIEAQGVRDSTTVVTWTVTIDECVTQPSDT